MRKILILTISILLLFSLGLSWATSQERIIYFQDGTTLEDAAIALASFNLSYESEFRWEHPNDVTTWRGGIQYDPALDNITQVRNIHWQNYYNLLLREMTTLENRAGVAASAEDNPQFAASKNEQARLDESILDCWLDDSCPPVPVVRISAHITNEDQVTAITALPIVDRVENADSSTGFFSTRSLLSLNDDEQFYAPNSITFFAEVTENITPTQHVILQTLLWTDTAQLPANRSYSHILWLNDSEGSEYGPGIFLDRSVTRFTRRPIHEPDSNLPDFSIQSRIGDFQFEKRFGITVEEIDQIEADVTYFLLWETPPGDAELDNGNVEMELSGILDRRSCKIFFEGWGIDPIPSEDEYLYVKPYGYCRPTLGTFIPFFAN